VLIIQTMWLVSSFCLSNCNCNQNRFAKRIRKTNFMSNSNQQHKPGREWEIESQDTAYKGFYTIEKFTFRHALFDGGQSEPVEREQFIRGNVVGVIAHDPKLDREVMHYLASPGSSSEEIFIYYAEADLSEASGVHGLDSESEDILLHVVSSDDAIAMLESGKVCNGLSIIALQWFRHHRLQT